MTAGVGFYGVLCWSRSQRFRCGAGLSAVGVFRGVRAEFSNLHLTSRLPEGLTSGVPDGASPTGSLS